MPEFVDGFILYAPTLWNWVLDKRNCLGYDSPLLLAKRRKMWKTFGWLGKGEFPMGKCSKLVLDKLEKASAKPLQRSRGYHSCSFCRLDNGRGTDYIDLLGQARRLGDSYFEIKGLSGTYWIAPDLVLHYIVCHGYLPPDDISQYE